LPLIEIGAKKRFWGASSETKPTTGVNPGDEWVETDTGSVYVWTGTEWKTTAPAQPLFGLASFYVDDMLIADEGITGSTKIKSGSITKDRLATDTIRLEIPITLTRFPKGLDAASTGVKDASNAILISSDLLACAKAIYFESGLEQITSGAAVAVELFGVTEGAVIASLSFTATSKRARTGDIKASLVAGREYYARINVTTAVTGGLCGGAEPKLIIVVGIS
jgi:hypothetical protein